MTKITVDWFYHAKVPFTGGVGCEPTDFQMVGLKLYYAKGTNSNGVMYLEGKCNVDFSDVRICDSNGNMLKIYRRNVMDSTSCDLDFLYVGNANISGRVHLYAGNSAASAADDGTVYVDIIENLATSLPLNEGTGNPQDHSGNNNTGTITGATWVTTGKFGNCLSFDGNDSVVCTTAATTQFGTGNFSYIVFFKSASASPAAAGSIISQITLANDERIQLYHNTTNKIKTTLIDGAINKQNDGNTLVGTGWRCLIFVRNGDTAKTYLDNALEVTQTGITAASFSGTYPLTLGKRADANSEYFIGLISNVIVINAALSDEERINAVPNFPDCTLEVGKCCVRKFASVTQPQLGTPTTLKGIYGAPQTESLVEPLTQLAYNLTQQNAILQQKIGEEPTYPPDMPTVYPNAESNIAAHVIQLLEIKDKLRTQLKEKKRV
jgi:hypothetical protein